MLLGALWLIAMQSGPVSISVLDPGSELNGLILWEIRFPRFLVGVLVGGALGIAGAGFQGILRNPLADPYILGVSSGAGLGAGVAMTVVTYSTFGVTVGAIVGGLISIACVYFIVRRSASDHPVHYILAGIVVNAFLGAMMMLLLYVAHNDVAHIMGWLMGDLSRFTGGDLYWLIPVFLGLSIGLWALAKPLNVLALGDDAASSVGVSVSKTRVGLFILASALTGLAVSVAGMIGFVGLVVPHMIRLIYKDDFRVLLPASFLGGAALLVASDCLARTIVSGIELPVGVITAMIGGPFFVFLLRKNNR